jgi:lipoate-protein ligase B
VKITQGNKGLQLDIRDCGLMRYREALALQLELVEQRQKEKIANTVLILEHKPVVTLGLRESENRLLVSEDVLAERGIDLVSVKRGGGTTAHNPGQVVLYPVVSLRSLKLGVNEYVRKLEAIGIELLSGFGINAGRREGYPGLWLGEKKIGSIGVRVKKWVTFHGMAVNISNDLSIFETIVPCGLQGVRITSVCGETGLDVSMSKVKERLATLCREHFA